MADITIQQASDSDAFKLADIFDLGVKAGTGNGKWYNTPLYVAIDIRDTMEQPWKADIVWEQGFLSGKEGRFFERDDGPTLARFREWQEGYEEKVG